MFFFSPESRHPSTPSKIQDRPVIDRKAISENITRILGRSVEPATTSTDERYILLLKNTITPEEFDSIEDSDYFDGIVLDYSKGRVYQKMVRFTESFFI